MKRLVYVVVAASLLLGMVTLASAAADKVIVYTPWKDSVMDELGALFMEQTGIKVESINISTGEIYARLKAEKANPQADVWHSVRALYLEQAKQEQLVDSYTPPNAANVLEKYRYPSEDYIIGTTMYPLVIVYNADALSKMGVEPPKTYEDLLTPIWKGQIVMPNPAASGTAFSLLTTIIQAYREPGESGIQSAKGWEYMSKLTKQVAQFTNSGSAPTKMVARGEYPVGIGFYDRVYQQQEEGYPVAASFPDPLYAEPSCSAIVANAPHPEAARMFLDFLLSKPAQEIAKKLGNYSVRPDLTPPVGAPKLTELPIFQDDDFRWAAQYKKDLLQKFLQTQRGM